MVRFVFRMTQRSLISSTLCIFLPCIHNFNVKIIIQHFESAPADHFPYTYMSIRSLLHFEVAPLLHFSQLPLPFVVHNI